MDVGDTRAVGAAGIRADATFQRLWLGDGSWVDVARGWLDGAGEVFDAIVEKAAWQQDRVFRYEKWIDTPRLTAGVRPGQALPHPALTEADRALRDRYGVRLGSPQLAWYRNGRDSVAFHRDRDLRWLEDTVIALLIVGARRPFLIRPRSARYDHAAPNGGAVYDISPGPGDLLVMGGRTQMGWEHSVPKVHAAPVRGRVSVQWRWTSRTGRPVEGASYSAPRTYRR